MSKLVSKDKELQAEARMNVITRSMSARGVKPVEGSVEMILSQLKPSSSRKCEEPEDKGATEEPPFFPLFSKLPLELRVMIWNHYALGVCSGQVVEIFDPIPITSRRKDALGKPLMYMTNRKPPPMLNICHETRAEAMKQSSYCVLANGAKSPIIFNPSFDAVYFRFQHWLVDVSHPGLNTIRHLIVDHMIAPDQLAKFTELEVLTIIVHQIGRHACCKNSGDMTKHTRFGPRVKFYKPSPSGVALKFREQQVRMDYYKLNNPLWIQPVLNVMCTLVEGKECCVLSQSRTAGQFRSPMRYWPNGFPPPMQFQTGTFWDEHCTKV